MEYLDRYHRQGGDEDLFSKIIKKKIEIKISFSKVKSNLYWVKWLGCVHCRMTHTINIKWFYCTVFKAGFGRGHYSRLAGINV